MQNRTRLISCEVMLPTLSTNNSTLLHVPQYWEQNSAWVPITLEKKSIVQNYNSTCQRGILL